MRVYLPFCPADVSLALDLTAAEVEEGEVVVASVVKESSVELERPIMVSVFTSEGTANGRITLYCVGTIHVVVLFGIDLLKD